MISTKPILDPNGNSSIRCMSDLVKRLGDVFVDRRGGFGGGCSGSRDCLGR